MGDLEMRAMVASIERLGNLPQEAALRGAPIIEAAAKAQASAGVTPTGETWQPTQKGGRPLANAAAHLAAKAVANIIVLTLKGVDVIHNYGTSRQPKRQILPDAGGGLPAAFAEAVIQAAVEAFKALLK